MDGTICPAIMVYLVAGVAVVAGIWVGLYFLGVGGWEEGELLRALAPGGMAALLGFALHRIDPLRIREGEACLAGGRGREKEDNQP